MFDSLPKMLAMVSMNTPIKWLLWSGAFPGAVEGAETAILATASELEGPERLLLRRESSQADEAGRLDGHHRQR